VNTFHDRIALSLIITNYLADGVSHIAGRYR
jgi:hypothetical protein